jgi:hypothetical protein
VTGSNGGDDLVARVSRELLARLDALAQETQRIVVALLGLGVDSNDIRRLLHTGKDFERRISDQLRDARLRPQDVEQLAELPQDATDIVEQLVSVPRRRRRRTTQRRPRTTTTSPTTNGKQQLRDVLVAALRESGTLTSKELIASATATGYRGRGGAPVSPASVHVLLSRDKAFRRSADKRGWTLARRPR